jgi:NDP-sugar pyrophosphorylase family protein
MKQAMIFAAGLGTRLKPLTDTMPKALVRVGGEPLLYHVIMRLKQAGFERIVVNVHHFSQQIVDYLHGNACFGLDIRISDETGMLLDTGGGIKKAASFFDSQSPVLIHNVDIFSNVNLSKFYEEHSENDATLLVSRRTTRRYLLFDDDMRLAGWTNLDTGEVKSPYTVVKSGAKKVHRLAFSGIHLFHPSLFPLMQAFPERFGIIDFYLQNCHKVKIKGCIKDDLQLIDVGKLDTLDKAEKFLINT